MRHTPTLHGATANTAHSAPSDQHITPVLLHHTSSHQHSVWPFLRNILTPTCPTIDPLQYSSHLRLCLSQESIRQNKVDANILKT